MKVLNMKWNEGWQSRNTLSRQWPPSQKWILVTQWVICNKKKHMHNVRFPHQFCCRFMSSGMCQCITVSWECRKAPTESKSIISLKTWILNKNIYWRKIWRSRIGSWFYSVLLCSFIGKQDTWSWISQKPKSNSCLIYETEMDKYCPMWYIISISLYL